MAWYGGFGGWKPYVPVAQRKAQSCRYAAQVAKREKRELAPVTIAGQKIARSFWGKAWCDNLERYSDYSNRLPRGRTYVRNGSVIDLQIAAGEIKALVSGSSVYKVSVSIRTLEKKAWKRIKCDCSQSIDSLIDLLQGRFDQGIMQRLTERDGGLFPRPAEIKMSCSCPDWAGLCKHVAAVLYGVGARLDTFPELLFTLRAVDHMELISQAVAADNLDRTLAGGQDGALAGSDLGELFGIEIDAGDSELSTRSQDKGPLEAPAGKRRPGCKRAAPSTVDVKVDPRGPLKPGSGCRRAARKKPAAKKLGTKKRAAKSRAATPARALATRRQTP